VTAGVEAKEPMTGTGARYVIDARVSRFTVRVTAGGFLSALGHNPTFAIRDLSGDIVFDPEAPEESALRLTVRASSLQLLDDMSEKDKREITRAALEDVLEAETYPEIRFETDSVEQRPAAAGRIELLLRGRLTLHGMTQSETLVTRLVSTGDMLRANGDFVLRQTDYGIKPITVAGKMLQVKNELNFAYDIVSRKRA
jgi:polyisoprenoid-binding protein YceI